MTIACGSCTLCCRSYVIGAISKEEADRLPRHGVMQVTQHHLDHTMSRVWTIKQEGGPSGLDCVFLGPKGCTVYEDRPAVCRNYDCRDRVLDTGASSRQMKARFATIVNAAMERIG